MTVKMPEPMTAPMPSAVSDHGPRVFFSACVGSSDSLMSLSIDLQANSWLGSAGSPLKKAFSSQPSAFSNIVRERVMNYPAALIAES